MNRSPERHPGYSEYAWGNYCDRCGAQPGDLCLNLAALQSGPARSTPHRERGPITPGELEHWKKCIRLVRNSLMGISRRNASRTNWWEHEVDLGGFCARAAVRLKGIVGGTIMFTPEDVNFAVHYFVRKRGFILDPTASQFSREPIYIVPFGHAGGMWDDARPVHQDEAKQETSDWGPVFSVKKEDMNGEWFEQRKRRNGQRVSSLPLPAVALN